MTATLRVFIIMNAMIVEWCGVEEVKNSEAKIENRKSKIEN